MGGRRYNTFTICFLAAIVLSVALLMTGSLRRSAHVTLPAAGTNPSASGGGSAAVEDAVTRLRVTPETVQTVIATLSRPEIYTRAMAVERLWSDGEASVQITVSVNGALTRTDTVETDGRTRHAITDGETVYIWYDMERAYYQGAAGDITADEEQQIPTYESILSLEIYQIAAAEFGTFGSEECVFVETIPAENGTVRRYWVSVKSGLLAGAEWLNGGNTIYRMAAKPVSDALPAADVFNLPDGTPLLKS